MASKFLFLDIYTFKPSKCKWRKTFEKDFLIANFWEIILNWIFLRMVLKLNKGLWSYSSWIYNYLCNQCQSALKLRVRIPFMARCTRYDI
jgi:hypothetical protein